MKTDSADKLRAVLADPALRSEIAASVQGGGTLRFERGTFTWKENGGAPAEAAFVAVVRALLAG